MDFNRINTETYRFYEEQKWDSLIHLGKEALNQEIDYYYLRMRIGIACYNKKNYRKADDHFRVALEFNQEDPVALEYLYYSMLFAGQVERSGLVRKKFRGDLSLRLPPQKGKILDRFGMEYLFSTAAMRINFPILKNFSRAIPQEYRSQPGNFQICHCP